MRTYFFTPLGVQDYVRTPECEKKFVKMLTAETIQAALDAELDSELGYSKYDYKNKQTSNSRNGHSTKTVQGSMGEMELQIPRDREGEFEPQLVKNIRPIFRL